MQYKIIIKLNVIDITTKKTQSKFLTHSGNAWPYFETLLSHKILHYQLYLLINISHYSLLFIFSAICCEFVCTIYFLYYLSSTLFLSVVSTIYYQYFTYFQHFFYLYIITYNASFEPFY